MIRRRRGGSGVGAAYRAEMTMAERQIAFERLARKAKQRDLERRPRESLGLTWDRGGESKRRRTSVRRRRVPRNAR